MIRSLYKINGTDRTVMLDPAFAARFGGMTLVPEDAVVSSPSSPPVKARAKTTNTSTSSKEGN